MYYVCTVNVFNDALHDVSVMEGRFQTCTVNVHPHALNLNTLPYLVEGVQSCCLDQSTSYGVGNMHNKMQGCTVYVQAATGFLKQP